jgi:hypothetical protein
MLVMNDVDGAIAQSITGDSGYILRRSTPPKYPNSIPEI